MGNQPVDSWQVLLRHFALVCPFSVRLLQVRGRVRPFDRSTPAPRSPQCENDLLRHSPRNYFEASILRYSRDWSTCHSEISFHNPEPPGRSTVPYVLGKTNLEDSGKTPGSSFSGRFELRLGLKLWNKAMVSDMNVGFFL